MWVGVWMGEQSSLEKNFGVKCSPSRGSKEKSNLLVDRPEWEWEKGAVHMQAGSGKHCTCTAGRILRVLVGERTGKALYCKWH